MEEFMAYRKIKKVCMINHPLEHTWWLWTTEEGIKKAFGVNSSIDLKPFGNYEIQFSENESLGVKSITEGQVLSLIPQEMISFTWKTAHEDNLLTWVVIKLESVNKHYTSLTLTHMGWPEGEIGDKLLHYYDIAWSHILKFIENAHVDSLEPSTILFKDSDGKIVTIE